MIDIHIHLSPPAVVADRSPFLVGETGFTSLYNDPKAPLVSTGTLLEMMDAEGLEKAVVMGFPWANLEWAKMHNNWLLEECQKYPDRLYPMAAFDPRASWAYDHAEEMLKAGMVGLGELCIYDSGFDDAVLGQFEALGTLCKKYKKALMVHVNEPIGHQYPGKAPLEMTHIYNLVLRCPEVKLILCHFGGGLPLLAALKKEVKEALKDVIFDTAVMPYLFDAAAMTMALQVLGVEHFALGTDFPLLKPSRYQKYLAAQGLTEEHIQMIFHGSAQKFFQGICTL